MAGLYRVLGYSSLFTYVVSALGFSESVAYALITVARKSREIGALGLALTEGRITVPRASRIARALNAENATDLIAFAATHTQRETDLEVARLLDRGETKRETLQVSAETLELLRKAQSVLASRKQRHLPPDESLRLILEEFLDRHEPVRKAERAQKREAQKREPNSVQARNIATKVRKPLPARTKHTVISRDQGRCTFIDPAGKRCQNDRWLQLHHLQPLSHGGADEPENLTVLCTFHHRLVHHQLREPVLAYRHSARLDSPQNVRKAHLLEDFERHRRARSFDSDIDPLQTRHKTRGS